MDSQGRSRLLIGGLTLAAVLLVIVLLFTQQERRMPVAVESPLLTTGTSPTTVGATADEGEEADFAPAQVESPLGIAPDSPLASPGTRRASTAR